jgi:hypothetical protein
MKVEVIGMEELGGIFARIRLTHEREMTQMTWKDSVGNRVFTRSSCMLGKKSYLGSWNIGNFVEGGLERAGEKGRLLMLKHCISE